MATQEVVLITGSNRGIGKGILTAYLSRSNTTVIAGVRNPSDTTSQSLLSLPKGSGSKLLFAQLNSISITHHEAAVQTLKTEHGITHIDILVANAGIFPPSSVAPLTTISHEEIRSVFEVNTLGTLTLFQTFFGLLEKAQKPRFFVISSRIGSITDLGNIRAPFFAYGVSKAAVNYLVKRCHHEHEGIICMAVCPGWVSTDMGKGAADAIQMRDAPMISLEDSMAGLTRVFDGASRETSGTYTSYDGSIIPW